MNKVEAYGYMEAGRLKIMNEARFKAELAALRDMDVHITIKKKGKRSGQQNRYYWGVVLEEIRLAIKEKGETVTVSDLHTAFKAMFNPKPFAAFAAVDGEQLLPLGDSTTEMNKTEFAEYLEKIIQWAYHRLNLSIPPAGTQTGMFPNLNAA